MRFIVQKTQVNCVQSVNVSLDCDYLMIDLAKLWNPQRFLWNIVQLVAAQTFAEAAAILLKVKNCENYELCHVMRQINCQMWCNSTVCGTCYVEKMKFIDHPRKSMRNVEK